MSAAIAAAAGFRGNSFTGDALDDDIPVAQAFSMDNRGMYGDVVPQLAYIDPSQTPPFRPQSTPAVITNSAGSNNSGDNGTAASDGTSSANSSTTSSPMLQFQPNGALLQSAAAALARHPHASTSASSVAAILLGEANRQDNQVPHTPPPAYPGRGDSGRFRSTGDSTSSRTAVQQLIGTPNQLEPPPPAYNDVFRPGTQTTSRDTTTGGAMPELDLGPSAASSNGTANTANADAIQQAYVPHIVNNFMFLRTDPPCVTGFNKQLCCFCFCRPYFESIHVARRLALEAFRASIDELVARQLLVLSQQATGVALNDSDNASSATQTTRRETVSTEQDGTGSAPEASTTGSQQQPPNAEAQRHASVLETLSASAAATILGHFAMLAPEDVPAFEAHVNFARMVRVAPCTFVSARVSQ